MKKFSEWLPYKQSLDIKEHKPPFVSEGDIWWVSIGENVGSEISGKSKQFSRPGVILRKLSHTFYLIVPTTTKERTGTWYVPFSQQGQLMTACLQQVRTIDYRRLSSKLGTLDGADFTAIKSGFKSLYCRE